MSDRITVDPLLCHGKPCIRGLRYPVENVLEWLASGMTTEDILADYADLEREDILAALSFPHGWLTLNDLNVWRHEIPGRCSTSPAHRQLAE
ncbi:DUF433 domain-containing protein [Propionivibrio sp.]|uniref:DUF433 domain-containing protein n=1 Tax=Propionivibrio sp. TaxID=2212460 RepID=UPI003BF35BF0